MVLLMLFALLAGAGTALSPCVLPVLPAVLSAGVTGGRRRPLGVVTGLVVSFTFAVVALVYVIHALGLPNDLLRNVAIGVLFAFGFTLLIPSLSDRIEAWLSRVAPGPHGGGRDGFGSGFVLGFSLGFVYAPCAGPILAGVITVSAAQDFTAGRLAVALAYAVGSGAVLYALMAGGRRLTDKLAPIRGQVQIAMGAVMICVATLMAFSLDTRFQTAIASDLPGFLVNPTGGIEKSSAVEGSLAGVRAPAGGGATVRFPEEALDQPVTLPHGPPAPQFTNPGEWFNTDGKSLTMADLRGRVVLIDFWTYTCINCLRTLPYIESWYEKYKDDGLTIVGVHTPEFPFEHDADNVRQAIADNHLTYPVVQDNDYGTWDAYGNRAWPADWLVDADGNVRDLHEGEGDYEETEQAIRTLLRDAGHSDLGTGAKATGVQGFSTETTTPESYLGSARAERFVNGRIAPGDQDFGTGAYSLPPEHLAYNGNWDITPEAATAGAGATLSLSFNAKQVFLVLGSQGATRPLQVELDGKPVPKALAGSDVRHGVARISRQRLYRLIDLPRVGRHTLTLHLAPGISGYAFTFG
jgi:cytochrome c biogenesis protein CcdA/thiol-disulfide isomerase/thioredoxin